jgi:tRNA(Ile)-lysidine synthase
MHKAGYDFVMLHCNFQLREKESERDELFVIEMGKAYRKEVRSVRFDTANYAKEHNISIQVAARNLRYDWFRSVRQEMIGHKTGQLNPQTDLFEKVLEKPIITDNENKVNLKTPDCYILTAHHADDNIETVAMNFFRGTGLYGLTGMQEVNDKIFRPLLAFRKVEILGYARDNELSFVEDSSNANSYYTRNYFRNDLLPAVQKVFPQAEENILHNIERLNEISAVYDEAIMKIKSRLIVRKGKEENIPILKLKKEVTFKTILWEVIKEKSFSAAQTDEVIRLMNAENSSYIDSQTHRIIKNRRWLIISPLETVAVNQLIIINEQDTKVSFAGGELIFHHNIDKEKFSITSDKNEAAIDAALLGYPLFLRRWQKGDYFYPLGMQKKKKVSRFLIDQKLSLPAKENTWVLESNKKIVWIINQRIDDRFKVNGKTQKICKVISKSDH